MSKKIFKSLASSWSNVTSYFESEEAKAQKNPLYNSFTLYAKDDFKMAFELLKKGYIPSTNQKNAFNQNLSQSASKDIDFLHKYQLYTDHLPVEAIVQYCLNHDLSIKCKNSETIFDNFKHIFEQFSKQDNFSKPIYEAMKNSITVNGAKLAHMKPKYEHTHSFELNQNELKIRNEYTSKIYNSLVLIPFIIEHLDQFVALKSAIEQSVSMIEHNLQKHNVRVWYDEENSIYSHKDNCIHFKVKTLNGWKDYLNKYDTTSLQDQLVAKLNPISEDPEKNIVEKEQLQVENKTDNKNIFNHNADPTFIKVIHLKDNLNGEQQTKVEVINNLYKKIRIEQLNINELYDLESLYKDVPHVIEKFISIDPQYRDTLKNIEGKSPEQIMVEALDSIETKFNSYLHNINHLKVSDLSVVGRTIKMKM